MVNIPRTVITGIPPYLRLIHGGTYRLVAFIIFKLVVTNFFTRGKGTGRLC